MNSLLGQKIAMTRIFNDAGESVPVTLVKVGPCFVTQIKSSEKDGYAAAQLAYGKKNKFKDEKKAKPTHFSFVKEVEVGEGELEVGAEFSAAMFNQGDTVEVSAHTKGRGFTGVVKRHGFAGAPKTHGHKHDLRKPGSIGSAFPQHVVKGKRMAGRSGNEKRTIKNLEVVRVNPEEGVIAVKGSIPGSPKGFVVVKRTEEAKQVESKQ